MNKLIVLVIVVLIGATASLGADEGETIFKSQGCMSCHRPESISKVNPSLSDISRAYSGKEDQLIRYLKGETESIVKPEKASMMKRYIQKTQALSDQERKALAVFIMSH